MRDLTRALGNYGLKDGDVVVLRQAERRPAAQPAIPGRHGKESTKDFRLNTTSVRLRDWLDISVCTSGGFSGNKPEPG